MGCYNCGQGLKYNAYRVTVRYGVDFGRHDNDIRLPKPGEEPGEKSFCSKECISEYFANWS